MAKIRQNLQLKQVPTKVYTKNDAKRRKKLISDGKHFILTRMSSVTIILYFFLFQQTSCTSGTV